MSSHLWILISVMILIVFLAILALIFHRGKPAKPDYYTFFILGIIWLPLGLVLDNDALWPMGIVFLTIGLANRDKWKKNHRRFEDMTKEEQKWHLIIMGILIFLLIAGAAAFFLVK